MGRRARRRAHSVISRSTATCLALLDQLFAMKATARSAWPMGVALLAIVCLQVAVVHGRPTFVALIPNANGPLGHTNSVGGGPLNAFGEAFSAQGHEWTTALCQADSDGDGATNGEELGDPCCLWKPSNGDVDSTRSSFTTHPGEFNSFTAEQLEAMKCNEAAIDDPEASSAFGSTWSAWSDESGIGSWPTEASTSFDGDVGVELPGVRMTGDTLPPRESPTATATVPPPTSSAQSPVTEARRAMHTMLALAVALLPVWL